MFTSELSKVKDGYDHFPDLTISSVELVVWILQKFTKLNKRLYQIPTKLVIQKLQEKLRISEQIQIMIYESNEEVLNNLKEFNGIKSFLLRNSLTWLNPKFRFDWKSKGKSDEPPVDSWDFKIIKGRSAPVMTWKYIQMIEINTILRLIEEMTQKAKLQSINFTNNPKSYEQCFIKSSNLKNLERLNLSNFSLNYDAFRDFN